MVLYRFDSRNPTIGEDTNVGQSAEFIRDVRVGKQRLRRTAPATCAGFSVDRFHFKV
jgi:hypothetical protein